MTSAHRKRPRVCEAMLADAAVNVQLCLHHAVRRAVARFQRQRVKMLITKFWLVH